MSVVIADDDPFERRALARVLELAGFDVDVHDSDGEPSIAIIGIESFGAHFPRFARRCRVLVLTGSEQGAQTAEALEAGACVVLFRDGPLDDIVAQIRNLLKQA